MAANFYEFSLAASYVMFYNRDVHKTLKQKKQKQKKNF